MIKEPEVKKKLLCHLVKHANYLLSGALAKDVNKSLKEFALKIVPFLAMLSTETRWKSRTRRKKAAREACGLLVFGRLTMPTPRGRGPAGSDGCRALLSVRLLRNRFQNGVTPLDAVAGVKSRPSEEPPERARPTSATRASLREVSAGFYVLLIPKREAIHCLKGFLLHGCDIP